MRVGQLGQANAQLSDRDRRVAELAAAGWAYRKIAAALGCSAKTVQRALARSEVRKLAAELREQKGDPDAVGTLRSALTASRSNGSPDWPTRVSAARALLLAPEAVPEGAAIPEGAIIVTREGQEFAR